MLGSNILQSLNATANMFWVSRVLGEAGVTATNNANQLFFMMLGAAFGITMAANILIGQAVGAKDEALARKVVGTATIFFAVISILVEALAGGSPDAQHPGRHAHAGRRRRSTPSPICG